MTHIAARHVRVIPHDADHDTAEPADLRRGSRLRARLRVAARPPLLHRLSNEADADAHARRVAQRTRRRQRRVPQPIHERRLRGD